MSLTVIALLYPAGLFAQTPPPGPAGAQPSSEASRFQDQLQRRKAALQTKGEKPPPIEIQEKKEAAPAVSGVTFVLKGIKITGMTVFKPEEFTKSYEKYIGKEITFKEINDLVDQIKYKYKGKGYLTTNVYVPEQEILGGVVEIRVIEGKMGKLIIEGNKWFTKNVIEKYIHTKKNEILNIKTLQRDLLRLNQNPDLEVKTVISAGEDPRTSDITLKVKDKFPYHIGGGADNQGTRFSGDYRASASVRSTNLTANNDFAFFNSTMSSDSSGEFASYSIPMDTYGTKFGFEFSYFTSTIGKEFRDFDIVGITLNFVPHVTGEVYLSEDLQITADAGLNIKSVKKFTHADITNDDELRMPYYKMDIVKTDGWFGGGQTVFSPEIMFGTGGFLNASHENQAKAARPGTDGYYFRYDHNIRRVQRMPWESYMLMRHQLQAASHTLPSSEQFQLGGQGSVRGYPEGDYLADTAATLNLDWIFPMYLIPKEYKLPRSTTPLRNQIQPVVFLDMGGGYIKNKLQYEKGCKFLMGVGGGVRINLYDHVNVRLEFAQAIAAHPTANSGPSTFHLTANFDM